MPYIKNCPAQTKKEQPKAKRTIDRVLCDDIRFYEELKGGAQC